VVVVPREMWTCDDGWIASSVTSTGITIEVLNGGTSEGVRKVDG
jgi:hypothetical protein